TVTVNRTRFMTMLRWRKASDAQQRQSAGRCPSMRQVPKGLGRGSGDRGGSLRGPLTRVTREGGAIEVDHRLVFFVLSDLLGVLRIALAAEGGARNLGIDALRFQFGHE